MVWFQGVMARGDSSRTNLSMQERGLPLQQQTEGFPSKDSTEGFPSKDSTKGFPSKDSTKVAEKERRISGSNRKVRGPQGSQLGIN
jgi:hypothetical protein